jgi:hypothetical protein
LAKWYLCRETKFSAWAIKVIVDHVRND